MKALASVPVLALALTGVAWADKPTQVEVVNPSLAVEIANADPVPVTISPSEEPYQLGTVPTQFNGAGTSVALVTVPAGKALVIEHVSVQLNVTSASGLNSVNLNKLVVEGGIGHFEADEIACAQQGSTANGLNHFYACNVQTLFHVAAGQTLNFSLGTAESGGGFYRVFISGHYVPAP